MATSKITISFNRIPEVDSVFAISDSLTPSIIISETFVLERIRQGESTTYENIPAENTLLHISKSLVNYFNSINSDYNNTSLYNITVTPSQLVIEANNPNSSFSIVTPNIAVDVVTENEPAPTVFTIDDVTISQSDTNPCDKVKLTITTNEQADHISSPINENVSSNPIVFDTNRGAPVIIVEKGEELQLRKIQVPKLLSTYFSISKSETPSKVSIVVNNTLPTNTLFTVDYSIDNINWQSSTNFPSLSSGDYTLYIRDNIGCSTSLPFSIDAFGANLIDYEGLCEISNINSIRYKEDVEWNDFVLKTPDNTLSFEENIRLPNRSFTQPFTNLDIIPTQIKTNYESVTASLIDENETETPLIVEKRTNNMNIEDVRDAEIVFTTYNDTGYTGVKFNGGKVYDSLTLEYLTDYNIGENVPSWMNANDWINIEGLGWYKILDIVYSIDAYVVIINLLADDFPFVLPVNKKVTSVHNLVDWENYEFSVNFTNKEGYYKIKVNCSDSNFGNKDFLSEWMSIKDTHANTYLIQAYNTKNNEINFSTGFKSTVRIPFIKRLKWKTNTEQEIYVTDTQTTALENKYRGFWEFESNLLPTMMAEKLALILLQDRLFIDNVSYIVEGSVESIPVGGQYQIKANLVKSNYVFNSNSGKYFNLNTIEGTLLSISPGGGFLRVD